MFQQLFGSLLAGSEHLKHLLSEGIIIGFYLFNKFVEKPLNASPEVSLRWELPSAVVYDVEVYLVAIIKALDQLFQFRVDQRSFLLWVLEL